MHADKYDVLKSLLVTMKGVGIRDNVSYLHHGYA